MTKGNFKENEVFHEKAIPIVDELVDKSDLLILQPESLLTISIKALAKAMHHNRNLITASLMTHRLCHYFKQIVSEEFMDTMNPKGTPDFKGEAPKFAFVLSDSISLQGVKLLYQDVEVLLYFLHANEQLRVMRLNSNRLNFAGMELIYKQLSLRTWPFIESIDLSFNKIELTGLKNLMSSIEKNRTVRILKLSGCSISASGAVVISDFLGSDLQQLEELDLSFNIIQATGAESIAKQLKINKHLHSLNLRHNNIGIMGGEALLDAMQFNFDIRFLCVADNKVGPEVATHLAGRLRGSIADVARSVCSKELIIPSNYLEKVKVRNFKKE